MRKMQRAKDRTEGKEDLEPKRGEFGKEKEREARERELEVRADEQKKRGKKLRVSGKSEGELWETRREKKRARGTERQLENKKGVRGELRGAEEGKETVGREFCSTKGLKFSRIRVCKGSVSTGLGPGCDS